MSLTPAQCARALHGLVEPIHASLYFAKEVQAELAELGLDPRTSGYFASRAAPFGPVGPRAVAATFFNFNPAVVGMFLPAAWDVASPEKVMTARAAGWEAMYASCGGSLDGIAEATELAAAAAAACDLAGRPLAGANADVAVPSTPFAALQQYLAILREHRGDGHVALLVASGLPPVEVLALYSAWQGRVSRRFLQASRGWDDVAWGVAEDGLRVRGWMDAEGALTPDGLAWRDEVEADTDRLASAPWAALGEEGARRLFELLQVVGQAIDEGGVFPRSPNLPGSFEAALAA